MNNIFVPPDPRDNKFDKVLSREEETVMAETLFGFEKSVAKRVCFERWYRRHVTHEGWYRNPRTLLYPIPKEE